MFFPPPSQPKFTGILHTSVCYSVCKLGLCGITEGVHIPYPKAQCLHHTKQNVAHEETTAAFFKKSL
jgi:hypothetical protein